MSILEQTFHILPTHEGLAPELYRYYGIICKIAIDSGTTNSQQLAQLSRRKKFQLFDVNYFIRYFSVFRLERFKLLLSLSLLISETGASVTTILR